MGVYTLLDKYRPSDSTRAQGDKFERLIKNYLLTDRTYQIQDAWLWSEFPYREQLGGNDTGIDIVARTRSGQWYAVQCKFYNKGAVSKADIDTFLSASSRTFVVDAEHSGKLQTASDELAASGERQAESSGKLQVASGKQVTGKGNTNHLPLSTNHYAPRTGFDARYIIYTGRETWGRIAEDAIVNQNPPVVRITTSCLAAANVTQ